MVRAVVRCGVAAVAGRRVLLAFLHGLHNTPKSMTYRQSILLVLLSIVSSLKVVSCFQISHCRGFSRACSQPLRLAPPVDVGPATISIISTESQVLVDSTTHSNNLKLYEKDSLPFGVSRDAIRATLDPSVVDQSDSAPSILLSSSSDTSDASFTPEQAGKWFFVAYIVVSFAAGFKEVGADYKSG